jgi:hypothetical protein
MTPDYLPEHRSASDNFIVLEEDKQFHISNTDEILPEDTWQEEIEEEPANPALEEALLKPIEINEAIALMMEEVRTSEIRLTLS